MDFLVSHSRHQVELDNLTVLHDQTDTKALNLSKQCAALESQLAEAKQLLEEEIQQKNAALAQVRLVMIL